MNRHRGASSIRILIFFAAIGGVALAVSQASAPQASQAAAPLPAGWSVGSFLMPH